jgi:predicted RNase H-like HicB family nuclease
LDALIFAMFNAFAPLLVRRYISGEGAIMKIKAIVHEAEEGGFWAEVPAIPGCATEGETMDELLENLQEAIQGCLSVEVSPSEPDPKRKVVEIAL